MKKVCCITAMILIFAMVLCACSKDIGMTPEDASGKAESLTALDFLVKLSDEEMAKDQSKAEETPDENTDSPIELGDGESCFYWDKNSPYENTAPVVYDGNEVTLYYAVKAGQEYNKKYILIINGIIQDAKVLKNDKEAGNIRDFILELDEGETEALTFQFQPNTGNKGDTLNVYLMSIGSAEYHWLPGGYINGNKFIDGVGMPNWNFLEYNGIIQMQMNTDAPMQTAVCADYFGMAEGEISKETYAQYEDAVDSDRTWINENHFEVHMKGNAIWHNCEPSENTEVIVKTYGKAQKYRICATLNGELLTPFDGCAYADISVSEGNETDVKFFIDTSSLDSLNSFIVYYMPLDTNEPYYFIEPQMERMTLFVK